MRYNYIVIEREYASGGRRIGELVAENLGMPCYGIEILEMAAEKQGVSVEYLAELEENAGGSLLYSLYKMSSIVSGGDATASEQLNRDEIEIIRKLSGNGPAVFVGRSASIALKGRKDTLRVFIHADEEFRFSRAKEYGIDESKVKSTLKKYDKRRENYYKLSTSMNWKDISHYDLVLNSATMGIDKCAEIILDCVKS
ncbi:MAG: cytidylate kinase-like family protein [Oscillospiraceae bacterium]|nr:cytidylate kinase-like family protein [Oscillospiraceae bacterium]